MRNVEAALWLPVIVLALKYVPGTGAQPPQHTKCYKCDVVTSMYYTNETVRLCKDFDYSDKFIVDCPYSTFCVKKIISAKISDQINGTERDCASQKLEQQNYYNNKWHAEYVIEDPYKEGCAKVDDKGARTTTTEYCYCKGDLCNFSNVPTANPTCVLAAVIILVSRRLLYSILA